MKASTFLPAIKASSLPATDLVLRDGERRQIKCPHCKSWTLMPRGIIKPHRHTPTSDGKRKRCENSLRKVDLDITPEQWGAAVLEADHTAGHRRATTVIPRPTSRRPAPAVTQMNRPHRRDIVPHNSSERTARDHRAAAQRLAAHRRACHECTPTQHRADHAPCAVGRHLAAQAAAAQTTYINTSYANR